MKDTVIEKEGKYYIQGKVAMLETSGLDRNNGVILKDSIDNKLISNANKSNIEFNDCPYFHLSITSDDEIKDGDWYTDKYNIFQHKESTWGGNENINHKKYGLRKIIATTDKLNVHPNTADSYRSGNCLPSPSESFIKAYIEAYNNGNVIEDVLVEWEYIEAYDNINSITIPLRKPDAIISQPKLKGNNIIIKKVKDSWSRDEVLQIINAYRKMAFGIDGGLTIQQMNNWTKENL